MSEKLKKLQAKRDAVMAFVGSPVHTLFVKSTQAQIDLEANSILEDPVDSLGLIINFLELKAQRRLLQSNLSYFEDAVSTLNGEIEELILAEQPNDTQSETE